MGTVEPRIHASASILPIVSFSSEAEPTVTLTLTLKFPPGYPTYPITIYHPISPLANAQNTLPIHKISTCQRVFGYVNISRWSSPNIRLIPAREFFFITLRPGEPHSTSYTFRPLGDELYDREKAVNMDRDNIRFYVWGMHFLEIGEEYEVSVTEGLMVHDWMIGDKDELIKEEGTEEIKWQRESRALEVVPRGKSWFVVKR